MEQPICNYSADVLQLTTAGPGANAQQQEKLLQREARTLQLVSSPCSLQLEKAPKHSKKTRHSPKYINTRNLTDVNVITENTKMYVTFLLFQCSYSRGMSR